MTIEQDLLALVPAITDGVPLGFPENPGWRFCAQVAVTPTGSTLPFTLGTSILGGPRWVDITADLQGLEWERGAQPGQRPLAGELRMRLNNESCQWCAWRNPYYGPGTLTRVLVTDGFGFLYCFTGITQAWNESAEGMNAYNWVDIVAWETQFLLNEVDTNALATGVGLGDDLIGRASRLLAHASWAFDFDGLTTVLATYQSTDLGQNTATEMYLTIDSIDAVGWSGRDGSWKIRDRSRGTTIHWELQDSEYTPDSLQTANDDERIIATLALARVGGSEVVYVNSGVAARYQQRSSKRDDLITVAEALDADLQRVADGRFSRVGTPFRPTSVNLVSEQNATIRAILLDMDITDRLTIHRLVPDGSRLVFYNYAICSIRAAVTFKDGGTFWSVDLGLDIEADSHWSHFLPVWRWGVDFWGDPTRGWGP